MSHAPPAFAGLERCRGCRGEPRLGFRLQAAELLERFQRHIAHIRHGERRLRPFGHREVFREWDAPAQRDAEVRRSRRVLCEGRRRPDHIAAEPREPAQHLDLAPGKLSPRGHNYRAQPGMLGRETAIRCELKIVEGEPDIVASQEVPAGRELHDIPCESTGGPVMVIDQSQRTTARGMPGIGFPEAFGRNRQLRQRSPHSRFVRGSDHDQHAIRKVRMNAPLDQETVGRRKRIVGPADDPQTLQSAYGIRLLIT